MNDGMNDLISARRIFGLALISVSLLGGCLDSQDPLNDLPVAKVNDVVLTTKEFAEGLSEQLRGLDALAAKSPGNIKKAKQTVINDFINRAIVESWAHQNSISVDRNTLEAEVNLVRSQFPDDLSFRQSLATQNVSFEVWQERLKASLLDRKVAEAVTSKLTEPTEADAQNFYTSNKSNFTHKTQARLRQIVVPNQNDAERLYREVLKTKNLPELARKFSIAPEAKKGGDLGWIDKGTLDVFDGAFENSRLGVLKVVKSAYGFHIIEVLERRSEGSMSFPQVKTKILAQLRADRSQALFSTWLEERVRTAKVSVNDKVVEAVTVHTAEK
jgi:peptidyl-prolyl cis-trans isomerase C